MSKSKTRKPDQRYGIINNGAASRFGKILETSQGPITFDKDLVAVKNPEQQAELMERYKGFVYPVGGERPKEPGTHSMFVMPDLSHVFRKRNRMERQEREDNEREKGQVGKRAAFQETEQ